MSHPTTKVESAQQDPDTLARIGGWLFTYRTSLPLPIVAALLVIPPAAAGPGLETPLALAGLLVVAAGEGIRLWAVHHIGVISRTRSDRLGPLIDTGPFSLVRNPLYLGNILLWIGFTIAAQLLWLAPLVLALLALEYHAIVRWEERLLESRLGKGYRRYANRVPRWIPRFRRPVAAHAMAGFSWKETLYSERGTLIAIAAGYALLAAKARVFSAILPSHF
jgi:protein-S-isoprenylcysteine O-methyltransferase Ste14